MADNKQNEEIKNEEQIENKEEQKVNLEELSDDEIASFVNQLSDGKDIDDIDVSDLFEDENEDDEKKEADDEKKVFQEGEDETNQDELNDEPNEEPDNNEQVEDPEEVNENEEQVDEQNEEPTEEIDNEDNTDTPNDEVIDNDDLDGSPKAGIEEEEAINEELANLRDFFAKATSPVNIGGKEVNVFNNPDDITKAKKMALAYSKKVEKYKEKLPYVKALEKAGLDNEDKLNLVLDAASGNMAAVKKLISSTNKDVDFESLDFLEIDDSEYRPSNHMQSQLETEFDDFIDTANTLGLDDKVSKELSETWDSDSVVSLIGNEQAKADLLEHMELGIYDAVVSKIKEKEIADVYGSFKKAPFIDKYRATVGEMLQEAQAYEQQQLAEQKAQEEEERAISEEAIQKEMEKIKQEREYKKKAEAKIKQSKTKKTKISKQPSKTSVEDNNQEVDIEELSDDEIEKILSEMIDS